MKTEPHNPSRDIKPALILVCGFARAGKDTLADGIIGGAAGSVAKVPLAESLKRAADQVIGDLVGVRYGTKFPGFADESFKVANRPLLVELGKTCRSLHQDCFVELALERAAELIAAGTTVIITDVRYSNELQRCADFAAFRKISLYTLLIHTNGVEAANEEERTNFDMLLIRSRTASIGWTDQSRWQPGAALDIYRHGRSLAALMAI